jgi:perosamine synthetase
LNPVTEFENEFKAFTEARNAIAVSNGTAALMAAIYALDLPPKSNIITTPYTFPATANAIILSGHKPVFVDVAADYLIDPVRVEEASREAEAILVVHLFGKPCNMREIMTFHLPVIEDCSQAIGLTIGKRYAGTIGALGTFSFYASKNLSTFEGGMVTTDNGFMADRVRSFINHGFEKGEMVDLGYNFKMPWICAFIGQQTLALHKPGILAELGRYSAKDGYYPKLVYDHKWYRANPRRWKANPCPVAERLAKEVKDHIHKNI